jgi:prevent-host-death family protein
MNEPKPEMPESVGSRYLRENIGPVLDWVANHHKALIITRHGRPAVAIVPPDWVETGKAAPDTPARDLPAKNSQ